MTKQEKETRLLDRLEECLRSDNQDGGIKSYRYHEDSNTFIVEFKVVEVEEDDYVGFAGY